ncbi:MAG TPA: replication-relaxation family protein [Solirubrobacteraceae bacterium]
MLRFLLWRILGLVALVAAFVLTRLLLDGGLGAVLRGAEVSISRPLTAGALSSALDSAVGAAWKWAPFGGPSAASTLAILTSLTASVLGCLRVRARRSRIYVRFGVEVYRTDNTSAEGVIAMFESLHKRLLRRWWRRLLSGQPSLALEIHHGSRRSVWLALSCPRAEEAMVETALRTAYPNSRLRSPPELLANPPVVLRLKKQTGFIRRVAALDRFEHQREPPVNRLMTVMGACGEPAFVQFALTPAPALFERYAKHAYKQHEARLARERRERPIMQDRSMVEDAELRGGLHVQHRPLFFADLRVVAPHRLTCERIASELRAVHSENRLVERGTAVRHGLLGLYDRRVLRGEGNPLPSFRRGVYASTELAALWQLPSVDFAAVPFARTGLPRVPAPPGIERPGEDSSGTLRDALGAVSIHPAMRRQNTAVPGAVEQGKSSYLVATVAEDLDRERCCVIVLDPKGDAAEAAVSLVPAERTCTLLDFSHPTCGFNPLAVDAPADVIADYVVAALKNLFDAADIRASSDRYLRNAIIAVLAYDRSSTLWDAARLLSVGEEGYSYRNAVGARLRTMPEFKEISAFFTEELVAQLADSRSTTTAKLDAPVNKLARLLNSPSIKRVLLNGSLTIDFDRIIAQEGVLVVKGALGGMGAGNTSVLMQLLVGMLDAALARQQDLVPETERVAVTLKVDEAPLVLNRGFAETMALKRSAGLETVACWQTDSQWVDRDIRDQLDALFAHRVYFATSSAEDARSAVDLTMAEFSDTIRPGLERIPTLGHPDARLYLPKHHAIASWLTPHGRQAPFLAQTIPLRVDHERLRLHATLQAERGGRYLRDLRQPHWEDERRGRAPRSPRDAKGAKAPTTEGPGVDADHSVHAPAQDRSSARAARAPAPQSPAAERAAAEGVRSPLETFSRVPPKSSERAQPAANRSGPSAGATIEGYRELVELDSAHSVRWARRVLEPHTLDPEPLDLEILGLVAGMRHVLSSQIHRRFNPGRASTTTQRRLKRLSDAGLVQRFQFHRRDGGGVPMCYEITAAGLRLLHAYDRARSLQVEDLRTLPGSHSTTARAGDERLLRQARHDVHVVGWALALERVLDGPPVTIRGCWESILSPPPRPGPDGRQALGPLALSLPGGRAPHEFMCTDATGTRIPVERFETVRPDATIELPARSVHMAIGASAHGSEGEVGRSCAIDLLVELDDRPFTGRAAGKLERYDHLLAGWSVHTKRYGRRRGVRPLVVFVCRDRARARECTRRADAILTACRAYAGEYPADWEYPGREGVMFVAERDVYEGSLLGYRVPGLPPEVRVSVAAGDPRARESAAQPGELPGAGAVRE